MRSWMELGAVAPGKIADAAGQAHHAAQWLARFARAFVAPAPDDSHTSLVWRRDLHSLATQPAAAATGAPRLCLSIPDLRLFYLVGGDLGPDFPLHGRRDAEAAIWARETATDFGLPTDQYSEAAPYDMPAHPVARGKRYDAFKAIAPLCEIARYFDDAELLLSEATARFAHITPGPSPIRVWPHHFDMAILIALEDGDFETSRAIGAGIGVPDKLYKEFYFYTYPWPRHERAGLPKLRSICSYQYDGFFGAVQTLSRLIKQNDQHTAARAFFEETTDIFYNQLKAEMQT